MIAAICVLLIATVFMDLGSDGDERGSIAENADRSVVTEPALRGTGQPVIEVAQSLIVQVMDAGHRVPLAGARVYGVPPDAGHAIAAAKVQRLVADANGEIAVPSSMWEEDRLMIFTADDHVPSSRPAKDLLVSAEAGRASVLLETGIALTGRVTTPWGAPVADAEVIGFGKYGADFDGADDVLLPGPKTAGQVIRSRTRGDGSFRLQGLTALPVRLEAHKPGFAQRTDPEEDPYLAEASDREHRIVLRPRVLAGLRVVDLSDSKIPDFHVQILLPGLTGPIALTSEASSDRPGGIADLGSPYRIGEWWVAGCYTDAALGPNDEGRFAVTVTAPSYMPAENVGLILRPAESPLSRDPVVVRLSRTGPEEQARLALRVHSRVPGLSLPWVRVRIESTSDRSPPGLPWTFHVDLNSAGQATREIQLPPGPYRLRLAEGTGWATWQPRPEDPWVHVDLLGPNQTVTADLPYAAALLRVSAKTVAGDPIGSFGLAVHDVTPRATGGGIAPFLAYLSEEAARWWDEPGHPYRAHLHMAPGLLEVLVAPGRVHVMVRKSGFRSVEPRTLDILDGEVVSAEFALEPDR